MFDPKAHLLQLPRKVKDAATGQWVTRQEAYLPVRARIMAFREQYPQGTIDTKPLTIDVERGFACFEATATTGDGGRAVAHGSETRADFEDFIERSETRAVGRCLGLLGFGTEYAVDMDELPHVADAPVAQGNGPLGHEGYLENSPGMAEPPVNGHGRLPPEARLTPDQARELKRLAQMAFGYAEGERRLRADLGFEVEEKLTLRHIAAHTGVDRFEALVAAYTAHLQAAVETDVP